MQKAFIQKKALLAPKSILEEKNTSKLYVIKCHINVTKKGSIRNQSNPNFNALVASTVDVVN